MLISVDPSTVGVTGLLWLFVTYGYVLAYASDLISQGSDLLLLIPSMAGLVGGAVLPLLGAIPDGAIMLFSGLGEIENAQESLAVGVGAIAGSTIMLLTIPWFSAVHAGRVNLTRTNGARKANYLGKPKLDPDLTATASLVDTGICITSDVCDGAKVMMLSTIPYFIIQLPTFFMDEDRIVEEQKNWALAALIVCLVGFVWYLHNQLVISAKGENKNKVVGTMKKMIERGIVSLGGSLAETIKHAEEERAKTMETSGNGASYQAVDTKGDDIPAEVESTIRELIREPFVKYDVDNSGSLDKSEARALFKELNQDLDSKALDQLFTLYDTDGNGELSLSEMVQAAYVAIRELLMNEGSDAKSLEDMKNLYKSFRGPKKDEDDEEENEDIPEDFLDLSPDEQKNAIKKRALVMLTIGTVLVVLFSDPMVDVMQEIAVRLHLPAFYVSFILAPIASNASEFIASRYYALKKTSKSITVSLTALEGAASMNNTFCLSIFMGLLYFRGLVWEYTAETIAIVFVQFVVGVMAVMSQTMTLGQGLFVLSLFPLSLVLVAALEACGIN